MRTLFDFLSPKINFTCKRYLSDPEDVKEAVQESMIKIFAKLNSFDSSKGELASWAYRISVNEALQVIRKQDRFKHESLDTNEVNDIAFGFDENLETNEVLQLINKLEGNYSLVFNLYYIEGFTHKEIAHKLGINEPNSRTYYTRAKRKLVELYSSM